MKYAFMTSSCPELAFPEVLGIAKAYGYDGVELRIANNHAHGIEPDLPAPDRAKARELAARKGIALCCVATSCRFADPAIADAAIADAHRAIDLARDLGAPNVRVFGGGIGEGLSREEGTREVVRAINALKDHAQETGVTLCLETHDSWCNPGLIVPIIEQVNHPALAVTWDLMHPVMTADLTMDEAFGFIRPWIRHVHFHDGYWEGEGKHKRVMAPVGDGVIDHRRALELLASIGYDGFLSGEWIRWRPHAEHLPQELRAMKTLEAELTSNGAAPARS